MSIPALDGPESFINRNVTKRLITFYCSIHLQHTEPIPVVGRLIIGVLLI